MPATVTTKEPIDPGVDQAGLDREIALRLKAGAIRAWVGTENGQRFLFTEWNVIGENG